MSNNLNKSERLSGKTTIDKLFTGGKSKSFFPIKVQYRMVEASANSEKASVLFVVPKRNIKRAVDRNLLKRRMRESYRLNKTILAFPEGFNKKLQFSLLYLTKDIVEYEEINRKILLILSYLNEHLKKDN